MIDREKIKQAIATEIKQSFYVQTGQRIDDLPAEVRRFSATDMATDVMAVIEPILATAEGMRHKSGIILSRFDALLEGDCPGDADIMLSEKVGEALKDFDTQATQAGKGE